jgi:hypothetical protein
VKSDCCGAGIDCTRYPYKSDCVNDRCVNLGCADDAECAAVTTPGVEGGPGTACRAVAGVRRCVYPCTSTADCTSDAAPKHDTACTGKDDSGGLYCTAQIANTNNPCGPPDDPMCWACLADDECDGHHGVGLGVCSATTHTCGCSADAQCPAFNVVGTGHWVCGAN